ncbi:globin [Kineosporia sp. NBRC 101731]|uniref:globin n=1 Tax=Kineosporia sp. NBRC 101731 TaxID=3032199 RepID=UPI0024A0C2AB|nr:globin [Kineosporia sp. NBRC 101731]GLY33102.1 globin [Kineosporia sp. NBRC 101731]
MAEQERQPTTLGIVPTGAAPEAEEKITFYEAVGGRPAFAQLVHVFYQGIAQDEVLRPMYPEEDLGPAQERLLMFLEQYWGGPTTYSQQRGHPRLRMRHVPFRVNADARDRWLTHMRAGVDSLDLPPELDAMLWGYLERAAFSLQNTPD